MLGGAIVFWWVLLFVVQVAERAFLLGDAARLEPPTADVVAATLLTGARADLIIASLEVLVALLVALIVTAPLARLLRGQGRAGAGRVVPATFSAGCLALGVLSLAVLTVDMAYYGYNGQHLDAVFFDYVEELVSRAPAGPAAAGEAPGASRQAVEQTRAEMANVGKWAERLSAFAALQAAVIAGWRWLFRRRVQTVVARWTAVAPRASAVGLCLALIAGTTGLHPQGPFAVARASISSTTYYTLAQNPIWQTMDASFLAFGPNQRNTRERAERLMPLDEAIRIARNTVAPAGVFPFSAYPLVQKAGDAAVPAVSRRLNVLIVFVEALDRRFVGSRLTPFLDRWSRDAVVFENFFANGQLTHHGLFSSLCSHLSGFGKSPIKARYTNDYLCLPALLQRAGYWTEMVIGYNRDHHQDHTALFLARNGVRRFLDEGNFPPSAERLGLGVTDGTLFDRVRERIEALQTTRQPFLLTTLTLSTHHPFKVPLVHPDVIALAREPDGYPATLRYTDAELERFLTGLQQDNLLDNTLVLLLGDHGRHEVIGATDDERWLGHHLTPLYVWLPPALRPATGFRPRRTDVVASQVDLAPTILALTGLSPRLAPFVGKDLSCVLVSDCRPDNQAALLTSHSAALARNDRLLAYGLKSGLLREMDLALQHSRDVDPAAPEVARRLQQLKALIVASALLVDQNRVWSWAELGPALAAPSPRP